MNNAEAFKFAEVRGKILDAVRMDLLGPQQDVEVLDESPISSYITGMLYPADTSLSEDEEFDEQNFASDEFHSENETSKGIEEDEPDDRPKGGFKKQASLGISCYVNAAVHKLVVSVNWGSYAKEKRKVKEKVKGVEKEVSKTVFVREQQGDIINIDLNSFSRFARIPLEVDDQLVLHVIQMKLEEDCKMVSVYLYNKRDKGNRETEYEQVLFQVELMISDENLKPVFLPEHLCRKNELKDEFYYENRAVYARGRGCAASWDGCEDGNNVKYVKTMFIPDYEINSVSPSVDGFEKNTFSMKFMSEEKNKVETIKRLKRLCSLYGNWIDDLVNNPMMEQDDFKIKGEEIIGECKTAQNRIQNGIDLLESNEMIFKAFCFMNEAMFMQRSITMYGKENGNDVPCDLKDFMDDDHSEWRPFQIAFVLLNLEGCVNTESKERENVDLLYFPTGGGKTEAYLGLIAFVIAYRRLSASSEHEFEKDGGVTVFLRYTLRLLTTQQRDRLMKLIVASEVIRERNPDMYGQSRFSIGFWVGSGVTPNKFSDYDDPDKKKDFIRKVTKQVIICPYCGQPVDESDYDIDTKTQSVKISCSNQTCHYHKSKNRNLPIYLVDEEIYRKCPTVVISTVDKFARLPWDEKTGLLFGDRDRICPRCGYIAKGENHVRRHNAIGGMKRADIVQAKPFFPPELIIQDELHLITGPLGTIYGGYEDVVEEMCSVKRLNRKVRPKYIVSTATIKNAGEQIRCLYGRENFTQFPPSGFDIGDSYFVKEISLDQKPFRQYVGICGNGQSVKTTLLRVYSAILQAAFVLSKDEKYANYIDPYYTLIGYFNSIRELGGAVRLLDDDIPSRIERIQKKYGHSLRRFINRKKEITSRIPSYEIAKVLEYLTIGYDKESVKQEAYDVVIATNMIAVGMDVDRLGLMTVVGQPKQNSEYIQATSRVGRSFPGIVFAIYNPYRPRDLSHYENFVGFHSQMYRYVEGTTATPFSARARDRVLHAIIVSLLRLRHEELAQNIMAGEIVNVSDFVIEEVRQDILERVKIVAHKAYHDVEFEINSFIDEWKSLSNEGKTLKYFTNERGLEQSNRLLNYYGTYCTPKEKPTLNSMREVEQASTIYYFNEEEI